MSTPIAVFDFCETLIGFQTANAFVEYVCQHSVVSWRRIGWRAFRMLSRVRPLGKRIPLKLLFGMHKDELMGLSKRFFNDCLEGAVINPVMSELKKCKTAGFRTYIVSGGYSLYINHFAAKYGIDGVVAVEISFSDNKCLGRFETDCMCDKKVELLNKKLLDEGVCVDYAKSYVYTDSETDLPLIKRFGNPVIVSRNNHQKWIEKINNAQEIIWRKEK